MGAPGNPLDPVASPGNPFTGEKGKMDTIASKMVTVEIDRTVISGNEWGGKTMRRVPDGHLSGTVTLEIDVEQLLQVLGRKALRSKGKRAQMASGLIRATVKRSSLMRESR